MEVRFPSEEELEEMLFRNEKELFEAQKQKEVTYRKFLQTEKEWEEAKENFQQLYSVNSFLREALGKP